MEKINGKFIMREDLREWVFKEDEEGTRYRERIVETIEKFGVEKWFKSMAFPTKENSVWKNRYTGSLTTLKEEIHHFDNEFSLEDRGYYLWENWLPEKIWKDTDLHKEGLMKWLIY